MNWTFRKIWWTFVGVLFVLAVFVEGTVAADVARAVVGGVVDVFDALWQALRSETPRLND